MKDEIGLLLIGACGIIWNSYKRALATYGLLPISRDDGVYPMTIRYFNNLRELNRFLKTTPSDLPTAR